MADRDIIERLRDPKLIYGALINVLVEDAAVEIERLREALKGSVAKLAESAGDTHFHNHYHLASNHTVAGEGSVFVISDKPLPSEGGCNPITQEEVAARVAA